MLRKTPSLAVRAGLIFVSIYTVIFAAFLTVAAIADSHEVRGDRHHGAEIAADFAARDLRQVDGSFELSRRGRLSKLAARNRSLWLIGRSGDRSFSFGPVPGAAVRLIHANGGGLDLGEFQVPNEEPALRVAAFRRYPIGGERVLIAAGGVDPRTLRRRDFSEFSLEVIAVLCVIAGLGFVAMLIALPLFSRAIRPIAAEAGALRPQQPDRRLDERKAPRELLPLVRAFNSTLDRLAAELARRKRFISDAAHELRTPLAVVSLRVEAMEEGSAKQELRRGVGRLTNLVAQMLDLERLSLSNQEHRPVDVVATSRDVLADLAPMAMKAGYEVSMDAPEQPVTVAGDEHAIARAVTNLIGNSVAHGGGAGQIRVVVRADRTIDVTDEGPGVPEALRPRLFEPFSRGTSNAEGCGLGLHLTREIMRAHGGDVTLVPSRRGATFRLSFPSPDRGS
jgi:signal transduction histidine kinase